MSTLYDKLVNDTVEKYFEFLSDETNVIVTTYSHDHLIYGDKATKTTFYIGTKNLENDVKNIIDIIKIFENVIKSTLDKTYDEDYIFSLFPESSLGNNTSLLNIVEQNRDNLIIKKLKKKNLASWLSNANVSDLMGYLEALYPFYKDREHFARLFCVTEFLLSQSVFSKVPVMYRFNAWRYFVDKILVDNPHEFCYSTSSKNHILPGLRKLINDDDNSTLFNFQNVQYLDKKSYICMDNTVFILNEKDKFVNCNMISLFVQLMSLNKENRGRFLKSTRKLPYAECNEFINNHTILQLLIANEIRGHDIMEVDIMERIVWALYMFTGDDLLSLIYKEMNSINQDVFYQLMLYPKNNKYRLFIRKYFLSLNDNYYLYSDNVTCRKSNIPAFISSPDMSKSFLEQYNWVTYMERNKIEDKHSFYKIVNFLKDDSKLSYLEVLIHMIHFNTKLKKIKLIFKIIRDLFSNSCVKAAVIDAFKELKPNIPFDTVYREELIRNICKTSIEILLDVDQIICTSFFTFLKMRKQIYIIDKGQYIILDVDIENPYYLQILMSNIQMFVENDFPIKDLESIKGNIYECKDKYKFEDSDILTFLNNLSLIIPNGVTLKHFGEKLNKCIAIYEKYCHVLRAFEVKKCTDIDFNSWTPDRNIEHIMECFVKSHNVTDLPISSRVYTTLKNGSAVLSFEDNYKIFDNCTNNIDDGKFQNLKDLQEICDNMKTFHDIVIKMVHHSNNVEQYLLLISKNISDFLNVWYKGEQTFICKIQNPELLNICEFINNIFFRQSLNNEYNSDIIVQQFETDIYWTIYWDCGFVVFHTHKRLCVFTIAQFTTDTYIQYRKQSNRIHDIIYHIKNEPCYDIKGYRIDNSHVIPCMVIHMSKFITFYHHRADESSEFYKVENEVERFYKDIINRSQGIDKTIVINEDIFELLKINIEIVKMICNTNSNITHLYRAEEIQTIDHIENMDNVVELTVLNDDRIFINSKLIIKA
uniref:ORF41 n=1 Tax=Malaco herpesvirus 2 TaxID=3031798 RepID=A0AA48P8X6_9VIRU|nr:TPA_asm: ORF41 [Malaco herpesvirus 2]